MKKKCLVVVALLVSASMLFAAGKKITFDIGPMYTLSSNHLKRTVGGTKQKIAKFANLGGINATLSYDIAKNFGVYGMANFTFGSVLHTKTKTKSGGKETDTERETDVDLVYAIDSQFGFFYTFKPLKNLDLRLGAGIGLGGHGWNRTIGSSEIRNHVTNIGAGINFDVSYMFTSLVGIYGGVCDTMYGTVSYTRRVKNGDDKKTKDTYKGTAIQDHGIGKFSNAFSLKCGVQLKF